MPKKKPRITKPRKQKTAIHADFGTKELREKRPVQYGFASEHQLVATVKDASMLDFYRNRYFITDKQYDAGYKLTVLWHVACKERSITAKYFSVIGVKGDSEEAVHRQQDAEQQYNDSLDFLRWPHTDIAKATFHVCINDGSAAQYDGLYKRRGMDFLREGLDMLVDFYRL